MKKIIVFALAAILMVAPVKSQAAAYYCAAPVIAADGGGQVLWWPFATAVGVTAVLTVLVATNVDPWTPIFPSVTYEYPNPSK